MGLKTTILVILVAIGLYFLLRPTDVNLNSSIFIYRDPKYVYSKVSDIQLNMKNHKYGRKAVVKEKYTRDDNVKCEVYEVTEVIPLGLFDWEYTLVFDTVFEFTKPGEELRIHYHIWYAGLSGNIIRTFKPKDEEGGPGCLVEEEMTIRTPWVSSQYVLHHSKATHPDSLYHMKLTIESMHEYFNERKE
ncbi:uncharacterized protein [Apostichopus japonicus]